MAAPQERGITYDSGALIAAERNDRRLWAIHRRILQRGLLPVVPTTVLAQVWRGGPQVRLAQLLQGTQREALSESAARLAGTALGRSHTNDVPDATVVVSAFSRRDVLVTSDRADIERVAGALGWRISIIDVQGRA